VRRPGVPSEAAAQHTLIETRWMERIEEIYRECERLSEEVDVLDQCVRLGSDDNYSRERLLFLSDTLERALLRLDEIDSLDVRTERKRAVRFADALAERVEDIKRRFGHELSIDYDSIFEELYDKYSSKMKVAPEVEMVLWLGSMAILARLKRLERDGLK
tara:strand:- start:71 stop:550 length:480 start_codon:yes stop_codon:yes gene_type:complete